MIIDKDDLLEWRRNEITQKVWKSITDFYSPKAWMSADADRIKFLQGQAELIERLEFFFNETKNSEQ